MLNGLLIFSISFLIFLFYYILDQYLLKKRLGKCIFSIQYTFDEVDGWKQLFRLGLCVLTGLYICTWFEMAPVLFVVVMLMVCGGLCAYSFWPLYRKIVNQYGIYENGISALSCIKLYLSIKYFAVGEKGEIIFALKNVKKAKYMKSIKLYIPNAEDIVRIEKMLSKVLKPAVVKKDDRIGLKKYLDDFGKVLKN